MIRNIADADIPWIVELCRSRYDMSGYSFSGGLVALGQAMKLKTALAIRSTHAFLVGNIQVRAWAPEHKTLHILALCCEEGHHWGAIELLRVSIEWAREQECDKWWLASETEHGVEALAQRVGAKAMPGWAIDLREQHDERVLRGRRIRH